MAESDQGYLIWCLQGTYPVRQKTDVAVNQRNTHKTDLAGPDSLLIKERIDGKTYLLNKLHVAADKTKFLYAACKKRHNLWVTTNCWLEALHSLLKQDLMFENINFSISAYRQIKTFRTWTVYLLWHKNGSIFHMGSYIHAYITVCQSHLETQFILATLTKTCRKRRTSSSSPKQSSLGLRDFEHTDKCAQNSLTQVVNLPVQVGGAVYN